MKKRILDEISTKAKKREIKKRSHMKMHGGTLRKFQNHAGKKIAKA